MVVVHQAACPVEAHPAAVVVLQAVGDRAVVTAYRLRGAAVSAAMKHPAAVTTGHHPRPGVALLDGEHR